MATVFTWIWKRKFLGNIHNIEIFKDGIIFGFIPDIRLNKTATINGKEFLVTQSGKWYS